MFGLLRLRNAFGLGLLVIVAAALLVGVPNLVPTRADTPVYADGAGSCNGLSPCFTTIQEAVNNAGPAPAQVFVFPGTYAESLDLDLMGSAIAGSPGDVSLTTVNASGAPTPGAATVDSIFNSVPFSGDITIDGFNVTDGIDVDVNGDIVIANVVASNAAGDGVDVSGNGNVTITNVTANNNGGEGLELDLTGDLLLRRVTVLNNGSEGIEIDKAAGDDVDNVTIQDSHIEGNTDAGIDLDDLVVSGAHLVNGNIICNNAGGGVILKTSVTVDGEGNWWRDASGPTHPSNATGSGEPVFDAANGAVGTVDFDSWIDTISPSATVDPVTFGESTTVSFQFSDSGGAVFLGQGPGDANGAPPFTLTTDNGKLTSSTGTGATVTESINNPNGILSITLVPDTDSTATVTVTGPCGLEDSTTVHVVADISLAPQSDSNTVGEDHTVTATITGSQGPVPDIDVRFEVTDGPNARGSGTDTTDVNGEATFTYTGTVAGTDSIQACFFDQLAEKDVCDAATKEWKAVILAATPTPAPTPTVAAAMQLPTTGGTPSDGGSSALPWLAAIAGALALIGAGSGLWLANQRRRVR